MMAVAPNPNEKDQTKPNLNGNISHQDKNNNVNLSIPAPLRNPRLSISNVAKIKMLVLNMTKRIKRKRCTGRVLKTLAVMGLIIFGFGLLALEILALINYYSLDNVDYYVKRFYTGFWFGSIMSMLGFTGLLLECKSAPWYFSMLLPMVMLLQVSSTICFIFYISELSLVLKNNDLLSNNCAHCQLINIVKGAVGAIVTFIILISGMCYFLWLTKCHQGGCKRHDPNAESKETQIEAEKKEKLDQSEEERLDQVTDTKKNANDSDSYDDDYSDTDSYISSEDNQ